MKLTDDEVRDLATQVVELPDGKVGDLYDQLAAILNSNSDDYRAKFLFGGVCLRVKQYGVARAMLEPLLHTHGQMGAIRLSYGLVLDHLGEFEGALNQYRHAEKDRRVDRASIHNNRASLFIKMGRYAEAADEADAAIKLKPDFKEPYISGGFARLALGDLPGGWDNYDKALGGKFRIDIDYGVPKWKGEHGARLIVHGEQGIGDEIMYASCLKDALGFTDDLALDCDAKLARVFRESFPRIKVYGTRRATDRHWVASFNPTHSIAIGSLPVLFRRSQEAFDSASDHYLQPNRPLCAMYRTLFLETACAEATDEIIGIAWSGGTAETKEHLREIPVEAFAPLVEKYPKATFVSLQYREDAAEQIKLSSLPIQHHHWATGVGAAYHHTAAAIAACDRVIATDTAVIHAAGAMGVQVDCLLSTPCMWVHGPWQKDRSAWYPSVKLHRKPDGYDWSRYIRHLTSQGVL